VVKEEYAYLRSELAAGAEGIWATEVEDSLRGYLKRVEVVVRIAEELVLPELADTVRRGLNQLAAAGDQVLSLTKIVSLGLKSGRLGESKRKELLTKLSSHIEYMEQIILPLFREEIATQVREDLGVVALDIKMDLLGLEPVKPLNRPFETAYAG